MLTYPWKCTVLHCNHLGNTWKPLVLMTRHSDYFPSASESSAPVVSRCFPGGYNVKLYISRGRLAWWLLAFCTVFSSGMSRLTLKYAPWWIVPWMPRRLARAQALRLTSQIVISDKQIMFSVAFCLFVVMSLSEIWAI